MANPNFCSDYSCIITFESIIDANIFLEFSIRGLQEFGLDREVPVYIYWNQSDSVYRIVYYNLFQVRIYKNESR